MQVVINIPFQKYLILSIFIVLLIKVGYCAAMIIAGDSMETLETSLLLLRHSIDTMMWFIVSMWFLHVYLYRANLVSKNKMHIATNLTLGFSMVKFFSTVFFAFYYMKSSGWMIFWSVIELITWFSVLCYLCYLWRCYLREYNQINKRNKENSNYSVMDELERRYKR